MLPAITCIVAHALLVVQDSRESEQKDNAVEMCKRNVKLTRVANYCQFGELGGLLTRLTI